MNKDERCPICGQEQKLEDDGLPPIRSFADVKLSELKDNQVTFEYFSDNNTLLLKVKEGRMPYEVDFDRITDFNKLLVWCLHLNHKTWMTSRDTEAFANKVASIKGWKINYPC